ncbi:hypothetical protein D5086_001869 [Populus alba]|uniref:Uncharacterized protein n=1 Tax=Populus alba TaxID=43335 RepID=A0ACC4D0S8_POPAL
MGSSTVNLPPGFRFCPSDEELVVHFLHRKAALLPCHPDVIPDLGLYPYDPWQLDGTLSGFGTSASTKTRNRRKQDYSKWVICRVYERDLDEDDGGTDQLSCLDEVFLSLDDLDEISLPK